jgi:hypothetical protein
MTYVQFQPCVSAPMSAPQSANPDLEEGGRHSTVANLSCNAARDAAD